MDVSLNLLEQLLRQRQREQQQVQDELDDAETDSLRSKFGDFCRSQQGGYGLKMCQAKSH